MDWKTILQAQQTDFINRMKSGDLFQCDQQGKHSELTVITDDQLQQLRDFCWEMADKYINKSSSVRDLFVNNMKGKLGEEVVKTRLGDLLTKVDYEKYQGGDGKVDFTLTADSSIGIQVKARQGKFNQIEWSISQEEINKNAVLVCILIEEQVNEAQNQYHLVLAGFLPTNITTATGGKARVKINELLYCGGLRGYLESLTVSPLDETVQNAQVDHNRGVYPSQLGNNQGGIKDFTQAIHINPNFAQFYFNRGVYRSKLGDKQGAIDDYTQAIHIDPNLAQAYHNRGVDRSKLGDNLGGIKDFTQAIHIDPNLAQAYYNRGLARSDLGDKQGAIDDYTQAIHIDPNYAKAYYNRGLARSDLGDKQSAIDDFETAANIYERQGKTKDYQTAMDKIKYLNDDIPS
ncbi:tetratricopeptide repeat protein [Anabaenopsis tanganyikae CS-531]|uniref:Tetratricopeptide repeat protein n=1 Tax=Anabaenopsis tanganyikae CS-531 TaxID=2785304 RepID=A0ABT6KCB5_9CYAN|nr:tetratricopeptide repeat protein [Anabaenopsis tanganyikae]MDH6104999.1 tetratricopeptide repeat protein [Anabaenopsis tanganyikae CS-531]